MTRNLAVLTAATMSILCVGTGFAAADDHDNTGSGFSQSPVAIQAPQQGVLVLNGSLVDGRCVAPWSNGAVGGGVVAPNSHYAACNTAPIDQSQNAPVTDGLL